MEDKTRDQSMVAQGDTRSTHGDRVTSPLPELGFQWVAAPTSRIAPGGGPRARNRDIFSRLLPVAVLMFGVVFGGLGTAAVVLLAGNHSSAIAASSAAPVAAEPQAPVAQVQPNAIASVYDKIASSLFITDTTPVTSTAKITKEQAEQAALAAAPGSTVDHSSLQQDENGTLVWDVDFTNGGGVIIDAQTGAVVKVEAPGTDTHAGRGRGGHGRGGPDQAALAAQATVTKEQAEQAALAATPGSTVDHSSLQQDENGTIFWDVDFTNDGGVKVNAKTGEIIRVEAPGTDTHSGRYGNRPGNRP